MTRPIAPARRWRRLRATSLRAKPRSAITACTRAAVSARTPGSRFTTRETVLRLTPAVIATSRIVGLATLNALSPGALTTLSTALLAGDRNQALTTLSTSRRDVGPQRLRAGRVERARRLGLHARGAGRDAEDRRPCERLAALERHAEPADERVARADRVANRHPRGPEPGRRAPAPG